MEDKNFLKNIRKNLFQEANRKYFFEEEDK
jgi:hypothetical protein